MKLKDIVPRQLQLGDRVYYTHRAATSSGRDGRLPWPLGQAPTPGRFGNGRYADRARWVMVWPQNGYGTLTGLTYRAEGRISPGYEDEQGYLAETERYPLYEVKSALRGRPLLIPPWACLPMSWGGETLLDFHEHPILLARSTNIKLGESGWTYDAQLQRYVDGFLLTAPEKVT